MELQTGMKFGRLEVLEPVEGQREKYLCRCECGNTVILSGHLLTSGHKKSCGCLKHRRQGENITGMIFGQLTVLCPTSEKRHGATLWKCQCNCGNEVLVSAYALKSGNTISCGCARKGKNMLELQGMRFGRLVAKERMPDKKGSSYLWRCQCDCGKEVFVSAHELYGGRSTSCGCKRVDSMRETLQRVGTVKDHAKLIDGTNIDLIEHQKLRKNNTSGHTGVQARGNKWIAIITFKKKVYYLGQYDCIDDAIRARKQAEERLFSDFIRWYYQNFRLEKSD